MSIDDLIVFCVKNNATFVIDKEGASLKTKIGNTVIGDKVMDSMFFDVDVEKMMERFEKRIEYETRNIADSNPKV